MTDTIQQAQDADPTSDDSTGKTASPNGLRPLCDEPAFAALLAEMVSDEAPRVFALVEEAGVRADGRIVAWGMAFQDHVEAVSVNGHTRCSFSTMERVRRLFGAGRTVRLVWPDGAKRGVGR